MALPFLCTSEYWIPHYLYACDKGRNFHGNVQSQIICPELEPGIHDGPAKSVSVGRMQ